MGAFQAAGMLDDRGRSLALVGGAEAMSRIQIGLSPGLSDDLRAFMEARDLAGRWAAVRGTRARDIRLFIPEIKNRATGKSMGEHTEEMAKGWNISREEQDELALASHQKAAAGWAAGFFDDLVLRLEETGRDTLVRPRLLDGGAGQAEARLRPHQRAGHAHRRQLQPADRRGGGDLGGDSQGAGAAAGRDPARPAGGL